MPDHLAQLAADVWELWRQRRFADALPRAVEFCETARELPGMAGQRRHAYGLNMLGALSYQLNDCTRADLLLRQALAIYRDTGDQDTMHGADVKRNLARVCAHSGNLEEAESLAGSALTILTGQHGEDHPETVACRRQLETIQRRLAENLPPLPPEAFTLAEPVEEVGLTEEPTPVPAEYLARYRAGEEMPDEDGLLAITPNAVKWRSLISAQTLSLPLEKIMALGTLVDAVFYLQLEGDADRHYFIVESDAGQWVEEIFQAIRGEIESAEALPDDAEEALPV